ncbi:hypothetical protein XENTR_v10024282 [Xenopus tropicalis]|uniref:A-kinase anchoring protein 19 n=1 Tax=Xenopus tropicalis TaxID=8364 RepID=SMAKA_XENTR|nr:RecName: Full=Small membrane A-kinase anchor protein; Short=Small membrane AKAP; Short=smAKAP [Xenopus tropicalis]KAE8580039.1 hypothetical protein XENTR_v10024282 [Xenopus tropicalis]
MGCIKSKQECNLHKTIRLKRNKENDEMHNKEKVCLVQANQEDSKFCSCTASPLLLEYAHRLSEDIVNKAVRQWAEVDSKYSDIPYIESDAV